jgi:predicted ATPase
VFDLVAAVGGSAAAGRWAGDVHQRTGGHPFLARQLAELVDPAHPADAVPAGVHDLVARRVDRLSGMCRELVEAAAVAGNEVSPDGLAEVCAVDMPTAALLIAEAAHAGVLVTAPEDACIRFVHDLFRESIYLRLAVPQRMALHQRIADALEHRYARGSAVEPADLARHCAAAVMLDGPGRAIRWARAAAAVERARLGFTEAAAHLARGRRAIEAAGDAQAGGLLVDLLVEEADARVRAGDPPAAHSLLDDATRRASRSMTPNASDRSPWVCSGSVPGSRCRATPLLSGSRRPVPRCMPACWRRSSPPAWPGS